MGSGEGLGKEFGSDLKSTDREEARAEAGRPMKRHRSCRGSDDRGLEGRWQWVEVRPLIWKRLEGDPLDLMSGQSRGEGPFAETEC